jgi:hypothetical protein
MHVEFHEINVALTSEAQEFLSPMIEIPLCCLSIVKPLVTRRRDACEGARRTTQSVDATTMANNTLQIP